MRTPPRVTVIIPTHNRSALLRRVLTAILAQAYAPYETVVVDDASTDGTGEVVAAFSGVRYVRLDTNAGPAAARNAGIRVATGDILAFTDDDCLPPPQWLPSLVGGLLRYPQAGAVGGPMLPRRSARRNLFARYERYYALRFSRMGRQEQLGGAGSPVFGTNNIAYRREAIVAAGGFDERFSVEISGEDGNLRDRVVRLGWRMLYVPAAVAHLRSYSWRSFVRQHLIRGAGAVFVPALAGKPLPSRGRILLRIGVRLARAGRRTLAGWPPGMILSCVLADLIDCYGQWINLEAARLPQPPARSSWL